MTYDLRINQPLSINELGGRKNNEDSIFPLKGQATITDTFFLVCDGVGGSEKGEIASRLACDSFVAFFEKNRISVSSKIMLNAALEFVENKFDERIALEPESLGMGTTLTLLHLHEKGATVAHCGDSRVYQVRNGQIIFQTSDHSFVNEMVTNGILTKEEALNHPKRNIITRAIQGTNKRTELDVTLIENIEPGDYFFMCTDGVLEQVGDDWLMKYLSNNYSNEVIIEELIKTCTGKTKDNFSAYLVQIASVNGLVKSTYSAAEKTVVTNATNTQFSENKIIKNPSLIEEEKSEKNKLYFIGILVFICLCYLLYNNLFSGSDGAEKVEKKEHKKNVNQAPLKTHNTESQIDSSNNKKISQ